MSESKPEGVEIDVEGGELRVLFQWRNRFYRFGTLEMAKDGSLYFFHGFIGQRNGYGQVSVGALAADGLWLKPITSTVKAVNHEKPLHFSLHPGSKMFHVREAGAPKGTDDVFETTFPAWFPVAQPFTVFSTYTPPMPLCASLQVDAPGVREDDCVLRIDDDQVRSLKMTVDVFPRRWAEPPARQNTHRIIGRSPHYFVRMSVELVSNSSACMVGCLSTTGELVLL